MDIQIDHLMNIYEENGANNPRIKTLFDKTKEKYRVQELSDDDIMRSARLGLALQDLA